MHLYLVCICMMKYVFICSMHLYVVVCIYMMKLFTKYVAKESNCCPLGFRMAYAFYILLIVKLLTQNFCS